MGGRTYRATSAEFGTDECNGFQDVPSLRGSLGRDCGADLPFRDMEFRRTRRKLPATAGTFRDFKQAAVKKQTCSVRERGWGRKRVASCSFICLMRKSSRKQDRFYAAEILSRHRIPPRTRSGVPRPELENLLLDKDGHIKIAVFGLCKEYINVRCTNKDLLWHAGVFGTRKCWMRTTTDALSIWWGLGVVLYEVSDPQARPFRDDPRTPRYFDEVFTGESVELTPPRIGQLSAITEEAEGAPYFEEFSYHADRASMGSSAQWTT
ncbi:hypothetical protein BV898_14273 [Hypsibius exemplaris]|uniref:Protein kinase C-terminal domain-containing protein n=1 Tax=Hypsibius exemplaris TaxID=2072580 RepID=A0A1W0W863_HYPEX|nr:hypothetical protein BV898_14273 [Hypsibius exemplaris]